MKTNNLEHSTLCNIICLQLETGNEVVGYTM